MTHINDLLEHVRIADILDVCVVTALVYAGLRWLRRRASRAAALCLLLIATLYVSAHVLDMYLTLSAFRIGLTVILLALIIVFQQDIRRGFEQLSAWGLSERSSTSSGTIDTLLEAVNILAKEKIGALLVIPGRQPVEPHVRGGVPVGGRISIPLLHSIFHPATQGHDGAVLIDGDLIAKLGVHLPLSKNLPEVGRSGTRHTAALGLAECCDALIIVVSEEQGTFSVAQESRLSAIESVGALKHRLDGFYGRRVQTPKELARRNWLTANWGLKLLAAATACGLWYLFAYDAETIRRTFHDVPIELRNVPDNWIVRDTSPSVAQVTLSGSERAFAKLIPADLKASIDLSGVLGSADILLTKEHFEVPSGLSLDQLDPSHVQVRTEQLISVNLPVQPIFAATTAVARELVASSEPSVVRVLVPDSMRASLNDVNTEPIEPSSVVAGNVLERNLVLPPGAKWPDGRAPKVTVRFQPKRPRDP
ncbi:MAG: DNA integrity scanning protein DisA nucleotide-binding domain protein [Planctomycetaceae bacterium]|nr:diadenylate cyclase [Planctomycetales bacterium]MCB9922426.1 DNA integrity scanning protein DisA nucleotide-binding domain protein [Planctomycetaceae bacterium]